MKVMGRLFVKSPFEGVFILDLRLNAGSLQELKPGVGNVLVTLWRRGKWARELERLGVELSIEKGFDALMVRAKASIKLADKTIELLRRLIEEPSLEDLKNAIKEVKASIATQREDPHIRAFAEAYGLLFVDHPYSRHPTAFEYDVDSIGAEDVRRQLEELRVLAETLVAPEDIVSIDLPRGTFEPKPVSRFGEGELDIRLENKPQTTIVISCPSYSIYEVEASFKMTILNAILGGMGLSSRLYREIRVKRGLAYYAYSTYIPLGCAGVLHMAAGVKRENIGPVRDLMIRTLEGLVEISEDELRAAINNKIGRLAMGGESIEGIANLYAVIPLYNLPEDYYERFKKYAQGLKVEDIAHEAKRLAGKVTVSVG